MAGDGSSMRCWAASPSASCAGPRVRSSPFVILTVVFVMARHARGAMMGVLALGVLVGILAAALDVRLQLDRR